VGYNEFKRKRKKGYENINTHNSLILLALGRELDPHSLKDGGILRHN